MLKQPSNPNKHIRFCSFWRLNLLVNNNNVFPHSPSATCQSGAGGPSPCRVPQHHEVLTLLSSCSIIFGPLLFTTRINCNDAMFEYLQCLLIYCQLILPVKLLLLRLHIMELCCNNIPPYIMLHFSLQSLLFLFTVLFPAFFVAPCAVFNVAPRTFLARHLMVPQGE